MGFPRVLPFVASPYLFVVLFVLCLAFCLICEFNAVSWLASVVLCRASSAEAAALSWSQCWCCHRCHHDLHGARKHHPISEYFSLLFYFLTFGFQNAIGTGLPNACTQMLLCSHSGRIFRMELPVILFFHNSINIQ